MFLPLVISVLLYLSYRLYRFYSYWADQGVPGLRFTSLGWIWKTFPEIIDQNRKRFGRLYGEYYFGSKLFIVNDPQVAREVSIREFHKFPVRYEFHLGTSNIGKSLFFMHGDEAWKRVRSIVSPAFTSGKLKSMLTPIERIVANFLQHLDKQTGRLIDIKEFTGAFAMDVIASCAFGVNIDSISQPNHPIVENAKKILGVDADISYGICIMFPALARLLRLELFNKKAIEFFDDLTFKIIEERLKKSSEQNRDLIGLMMDEECKQNATASEVDRKLKGISKEEISGQGILFFIAGFDTTNATFCHVLYFLCKHPEWQERLCAELSGIEEINYESLRDLKILNAIINETLRLKPALLIFERTCIQDHYLQDHGIVIPKGTLVSMQPYAIHRDPEYFPDPLRFNPERFVDKSAESNPAFMPFGLGPRMCVGMRFAQNELRIALANFVLNYRLLPNPNLELEYFKGNILLTPKSVMVRIEKR